MPVLAVVLTVAAAVSPTPAAGQTADATVAVEPGALAALDRMGAYLRTLQAFQLEAETQREEVLLSGLKVQSHGVTNLVAQRPDRLFVDVSSDQQQREYYYDGKVFTLWAPRELFPRRRSQSGWSFR